MKHREPSTRRVTAAPVRWWAQRNRRRLAAAAGVAVATALAAASATGQTVNIDCETMNADNIGSSADANGYTIGTGIASPSGALSINNQVLPLPANGIICVSAVTCQGTSRSLKFERNDSNTPVYLLVEGDFVLNQSSCGIDVSGAAATNVIGIGHNRLGGIAGPGGSDGGSCDFLTTTKRAGEGLGPGGGKAAYNSAGGGGASPVNGGGTGLSGQVGGAAYSAATDRILHGGSGGGCGGNGSTIYGGGGGGGGVIVIAAGGTIDLQSSNGYVRADGGGNTTYGGGGGGGVVRLVADTIQGSGSLTARGSAGGLCETSSSNYRGGCGGDGLIKIEAPPGQASGSFLTNANPLPTGGAPDEIVPVALERPSVAITQINAVWSGSGNTQAPAFGDPTTHAHAQPSIFVEAPSPEQVITVTLQSNNVPDAATVRVRMNSLGSAAQVATASTAGSGSGLLTWTASLTVPAGMELGTIEAWVENTCTPGQPGCSN